MLNLLEDTTAYGELFLPQKKEAGIMTWDSDLTYPRFIETRPPSKVRPVSIFTYLDNLYCQPGAVGFKLMYNQLAAMPEIALYLFRNNIRVVHLVRRNLLDVIISQAVVRKTNQAHILSGQSVPKNIQVELDAKNLNKQIHTKQRNVRIARALLHLYGLPHLEVAYEDLSHDPSTFYSVCGFLSINSERTMPSSILVKINRKSHPELISNYAEVKEALYETPFAHFIYSAKDRSA
jgi:LPS sulfotransferase NodH